MEKFQTKYKTNVNIYSHMNMIFDCNETKIYENYYDNFLIYIFFNSFTTLYMRASKIL